MGVASRHKALKAIAACLCIAVLLLPTMVEAAALPFIKPPISLTPAAPAELKVTQVTSSSVTLEWSTSKTASGYTIYYSTVYPKDSSSMTVYQKTTATTIAVSGLTPSTRYFFAVGAYNSYGESLSLIVEATTAKATLYPKPPTIAVPSPPDGLKAVSVGTDYVSLQWNAVSTATSYTVYYSTTYPRSFSTMIKAGTSTSTSYRITGLKPDTNYYLAVSACNSVGCSTLYYVVTITTQPLAITPPTLTPAAPAELKVVEKDSNSITLIWSAVSGASGYYVYYSEVATKDIRYMNLAAKTSSTSYTVTGLKPATTYYLAVTAYNGFGQSQPTPPVKVTTEVDLTPISLWPAAPGNVQAADIRDTSLLLTWSQADRAAGYTVYFATSRVSNLNYMTQLDSTEQNQLLVDNLKPNTTYYFAVVAYNAFGKSQATFTNGITTKKTTLPPPTNLIATEITSSTLILTWQPPDVKEGITKTSSKFSYCVFYSVSDVKYDTTKMQQVKLSSPTNTSCTINNLMPNTLYYVAVVTYDRYSQSSPATLAVRTKLPLLKPIVLEVPSTPAGLKVEKTGYDFVELSWAAVETAIGYSVYCSKTRPLKGLASMTWLGNSLGDVTSFNATGLEPNTTYYFVVTAYNGIGESGGSRYVLARTANKPVNTTVGAQLEDIVKERAVLFGQAINLNIKPPVAVATKNVPNPLFGKAVADPDLGLARIQPGVKMVGVWHNGEVRLRWMPEGEYIPSGGYTLYRVVNGKKQQIATGLGLPNNVTFNSRDFGGAVPNTAELRQVVRKALGELDANIISPQLLNQALYSVPLEVAQIKEYNYISGHEQFYNNATQQLMITPRVQLQSLRQTQTPLVNNKELAQVSTQQQFQLNTKSNKPAVQQADQNPLRLTKEQQLAVNEIAEVRRNIQLLANLDIRLAQATGFGFVDRDVDRHRPAGINMVTYQLVAVDRDNPKKSGLVAQVDVLCGKNSTPAAPAQVLGYGLNGQVHLRWSLPTDQADKEIITGYYVERGILQGDTFVASAQYGPIVIGNRMEGNNIIEPVTFFTDQVKNGETVYYRVKAVDLFGRETAPSPIQAITVIKTLPPPAPCLQKPEVVELEREVLLSNGKRVLAKTYISVPFTHSVEKSGEEHDAKTAALTLAEDLLGYNIYRSEALGTGEFSEPHLVKFVDLRAVEQDPSIILSPEDKSRALSLRTDSTTPDILQPVIFMDDNSVQPGHFYKYWVAAVDSFGNESSWSNPQIVGYPTDVQPKEAQALRASFDPNTEGLAKEILPGWQDRFVLNAATDQQQDLATHSSAIAMAQTDTSVNGSLVQDRHCLVQVDNDSIDAEGNVVVHWWPAASERVTGYRVYKTIANVDDLEQKSQDQLIDELRWVVVRKSTTANQYRDEDVSRLADGKCYLYLVQLLYNTIDENAVVEKPVSGIANMLAPGGVINIHWNKANDPQIQFFRVYRSEDGSDWKLVADQVKATSYRERVDQTESHSYTYKVTAVSVWGVESKGVVTREFFIPTTVAPEQPELLRPVSREGIILRWVPVDNATRYRIYRASKPVIVPSDLMDLPTWKDMLNSIALDKLRTMQVAIISDDVIETIIGQMPLDAPEIRERISQMSTERKQRLVAEIEAKYGVLALASYGDLSLEAARQVLWEPIGEIAAEEAYDSDSDTCKWVDGDVKYGVEYYYTVAAILEQPGVPDLESALSNPVSASPRKNTPPDAPNPIKLERSKANDQPPTLTWAPYTDYPGGGYVVFRSAAENGPYYQISPLLTENRYTDTTADPHGEYWYTVKIIDECGLISAAATPLKVGRRTHNQAQFLAGNLEAAPKGGLDFNGFKVYEVSGESGNVDAQLFVPGLPLIPVKIDNFKSNGTTVVNGTLYTTKSYQIAWGDSTIIIDSLRLNSSQEVIPATVDLALKVPGVSSAADTSSFTLTNAALDYRGMVRCNAVQGGKFSGIRIKKYRVTDAQLVAVNIPNYEIHISSGSMEMQLGSVTLAELPANNEETFEGLLTMNGGGLQFGFSQLRLFADGTLQGEFTADRQRHALAVPQGLALEIQNATLALLGEARVESAASSISGCVLLPFALVGTTPYGMAQLTNYNFAALGELDPNTLTNEDTLALNSALDYTLYCFAANGINQHGSDPILPGKGSISFNCSNWGGSGFVIQASSGLRMVELQAGFGFAGSDIIIDLSSDESPDNAPPLSGPDWLGLVFEHSQIALPTDVIPSSSGGQVVVAVTDEFYYARNGLQGFYEKRSDGQPIEVDLYRLGFACYLKNAVIDMYGSRIQADLSGDLEVDTLELVGDRKLPFKALCDEGSDTLTVTTDESELVRSGSGASLTASIMSGRMNERGLFVNGVLGIVTTHNGKEVRVENLEFSDVKLPSLPEHLPHKGETVGAFDPEESSMETLPYGFAMLAQPVTGNLGSFEVEVRSFQLYWDTTERRVDVRLGCGVKLADNVPLNHGLDIDGVYLSGIFKPERSPGSRIDSAAEMLLDLGLCTVQLDYCYQDVLQVTAQVGLVDAGPDGFEFKGSGRAVFKLSQLEDSEEQAESDNLEDSENLASIDIQARFGRKSQQRRQEELYYWVIKLSLDGDYLDSSSDKVSFGVFDMEHLQGVIGYNLAVEKDRNGIYTCDIGQDIDAWEINEEDKGNLFLSAATTLTIPKLLKLENAVLIIESGPSLQLEGDVNLYTGVPEAPWTYVASGVVGYYHPGTFKLSATFPELAPPFLGDGMKISGSLGFTAGPSFWAIYIGYPEMIIVKTAGQVYGVGLGFESRTAGYTFMARLMYGYGLEYDIEGFAFLEAELTAQGSVMVDIDIASEKTTIGGSLGIRGKASGGLYDYPVKITLIIDAGVNVLIPPEGRDSGMYLSGSVRVAYHVEICFFSISDDYNFNLEYTVE